jgi:hypothetical protein
VLGAAPNENPALGAGAEAPKVKVEEGVTDAAPPKLNPPGAVVVPNPGVEVEDPNPPAPAPKEGAGAVDDVAPNPPGAAAADGGAPKPPVAGAVDEEAPKGEAELAAPPNWKTPPEAG